MAALFLAPFYYLFAVVDGLLFNLMNVYEQLVYRPLQKHLSPLIMYIPREVVVRGCRITFFTANGVTLGRTALVVPVALCLKWQYSISAALLIVLHDFLDHVDGIVAKVHRSQYGLVDSPILGSFLDAFCDKIVNVLSLWTILLLVDYNTFSWYQLFTFTAVCCTIIAYEIILGVVRVQDYFHASYSTSLHREQQDKQPSVQGLQASMEGKTKEKLESMALAFFCLSLSYNNPMDSWVCICGCLCLVVSLRFAHGSLTQKLRARRAAATHAYDTNRCSHGGRATNPRENGTVPHVASAPDLQLMRHHTDSESSSESRKDEGSQKVDKVYTVGCFDLFHRGHEKLLKNMKGMGREVIVGVHNDESYFKLKKKKPIDNTERRMENVKKYADQVFAVSSTDPAPYLRCCVHLKPDETALYVRGNDMPQFPGRSVCEQLMSIQLLPYTQGVSSSALRAQLLSDNNASNATSDKIHSD